MECCLQKPATDTSKELKSTDSNLGLSLRDGCGVASKPAGGSKSSSALPWTARLGGCPLDDSWCVHASDLELEVSACDGDCHDSSRDRSPRSTLPAKTAELPLRFRRLWCASVGPASHHQPTSSRQSVSSARSRPSPAAGVAVASSSATAPPQKTTCAVLAHSLPVAQTFVQSVSGSPSNVSLDARTHASSAATWPRHGSD